MMNLNSLDNVFFFLSQCHDSRFIPDIDMLDETFPNVNWDDLENEVESFMNIHDLSETKVYWEGFLG